MPVNCGINRFSGMSDIMNSEILEYENELEKAYRRCEDFLKREERSLSLFTGDRTLIFMPSMETEEFLLNIKDRTLYIPVVQFLERDFDENLMMWSIYRAAAMYYDWSVNASKYLKRLNYFKNERENILIYFYEKIKNQKNADIDEKFIMNYVNSEFSDFLEDTDRYYALLRVSELCPVYKSIENRDLINIELSLEGYTFRNFIDTSSKSFFGKSLILHEKNGEEEFLKKTDNLKDNYPILWGELNRKLFSKNIFSFYREEIIDNILNYRGIEERDETTKNILMPSFVRLFKDFIDNLSFDNSDNSEEVKKSFKSGKKTDSSLLISKEEREKILREFSEENENIRRAAEDVIRGKINLEQYGVSSEDQKLYNMYAREVNSERNKMKNFWKKLIGDAKKEVNVKTENQIKGKLNVNSLINNYPDFVEAQRKGNYRNIYIFDRYILTPMPGMLPENIDISFVIDNSGSMNKNKVEYARKALILSLLSLNDFAEYLTRNAEYLHQKVNINIETFLFGTDYYRVLNFTDKRDANLKKSKEILSVIKLEGSGGSTDDGSCLNEILESIKKSHEREIDKGKRVKIIFEITDGASSFPGVTKKAVSQLINKNVEI